MMNDLWIAHYSLSSWNSAEAWDEYFRAVETLLGDRLSRLDDNDPARRKADTKKGEGSFVIQFGEKEDSRWLHGKFEKTKIRIGIELYKAGQDSFGHLRENGLSLYIPEQIASSIDTSRLVELFRLGNERFGAVYAYADLQAIICGKEPSTRSWDLSYELLGTFWLTYFGPHYCNFFARAKLLALQGAAEGPADGVTLQLAGSPGEVGLESRAAAETALGELSFAGYGKMKDRGEYALTLEELKSPQEDLQHRRYPSAGH